MVESSEYPFRSPIIFVGEDGKQTMSAREQFLYGMLSFVAQERIYTYHRTAQVEALLLQHTGIPGSIRPVGVIDYNGNYRCFLDRATLDEDLGLGVKLSLVENSD